MTTPVAIVRVISPIVVLVAYDLKIFRTLPYSLAGVAVATAPEDPKL